MAIIWSAMLISGLLTLLLRFGGDAAMDALLLGAAEAVTLSLELAGAYLVFMGLTGIVKRAGLMEQLTKKLSRVTGALFPNAPQAAASITMTFAANMLGMGNAATPFGLAAMQDLQKNNPDPRTATNEMCTFLAINSSCLQIIPTGLIALRQAAGSASPAAIVLPCLAASAASTIVAVMLCKILSR